MKLNLPHVVEYHGEESPWVVSFTSHNPEPDECVTCRNAEDAFALCKLVAALVKQTEELNRQLVNRMFNLSLLEKLQLEKNLP